MVLSQQDIDLLKMLRWCRYLSIRSAESLFSHIVVENLRHMRIITFHTKSGALVLTAKGNRFLDEIVGNLPASVRPSYRKGETQRRLHISELTVTAYRAGISVFHKRIEALEQAQTYYLTAQARVRGFNPWGSTRVAALARLGDSVYAIHYLFPGIGNVALTDELNAFNNNTARLRKVRRGLVFAGESYDDVLAALNTDETDEGARLASYAEAFRSVTLPVHLLSCDDTGALQLRIMSQPEYRKRLTMAALKTQYHPPPADHPEWDAIFQNTPLVMAVDMELRRIDAAIRSAKEEGLGQVSIVALKEQAQAVLSRRYRDKGLARVFTLAPDALATLGDMTLYTPSRRHYETPEGDVIDAPLIQADRKGGRQGRK